MFSFAKLGHRKCMKVSKGKKYDSIHVLRIRPCLGRKLSNIERGPCSESLREILLLKYLFKRSK